MNRQEIADQLEIELSNAAEWRREKAIEHPNDGRNVEAAKILDRLSQTVKQVEPTILAAYAELFEDDLRDAERNNEPGLVESPQSGSRTRHNELLREVGFHWSPETATEFVSRFISEMTGA